MSKSEFIQVENTSRSSVLDYSLNEDCNMYILENETDSALKIPSSLTKGMIQFSFCSNGEIEFDFGRGYSQKLSSHQELILYNPSMDLNQVLVLEKETKGVVLVVSIEELHDMFLRESEELNFLRDDQAKEKFYGKNEMSSELIYCVDQIVHSRLSEQNRKLFMKGKVYELLSLYFDKITTEGMREACPFLKVHSNVEKIKLAKKILLERMSDPPSIKDLASEVVMSEYQLKKGFKTIYGNTIYGYLNDFKMNLGLKILNSGSAKVKDVAFELGYTNPSHFITAFKKKFGVTPKRHLTK